MLIGGEWVEAASGTTFATYNPRPGMYSPKSLRAIAKT